MIIERDVAVPMRDGVKIYVDIHRPEGSEKVPALDRLEPVRQAPSLSVRIFLQERRRQQGMVSRPTPIFEGPDPLYWVPRGYAIVHVDPRGTWHSEGDAVYWGHEEGRDGHDVIEWLAVQDWCNGKVGMTGVSYLAIIAVADRGDPAAASRGHQSVGRLERHVPGVRLSRRHSRRRFSRRSGRNRSPIR